MAYLEVSAFKKLRAFFWALQKSNFNLNKLPAKDNEGMPVDKVYCLNLLHSFPDFQGEQFKDDNTLVKYLSKPGNLKQILDQFTPEQQVELTKVFEEKPAAVEAGEQAGGQEGVAAEQAPVGEPATSMTGGLPFPGMAAGTAAAPRRMIHVVRRAEAPEPKSTLYVADKSGNIVQERTITPTSVKVEKPETSSRLVIADKSGNIVREKSLTGEKIKLPESKIYIANKSGAVVEERTIPTSKRFNFRGFKMPTAFTNAAKGFGARAGIFLNRNIIGIARTGLGAFAGGVLTAGNPLGIAAGAGLGTTARAWGPKVVNGAIDAGVRLSNQVGRGRLNLAGPKKKIWLLFLGIFGAFFFLTAFTGAGTPGGGPTGPGTGNVGVGTTAPPGGSGGSIASCRFTRSDQSPTTAAFKSQTLLGYFQEASTISTIPAVVLAAVARVESPSAVNKTDADLPNLSSNAGCPRSPTGALGVMQVQPPGTRGYVQAAVEKGASFLGKTADQLTEGDFCDVRSNIIIASGFILKKLQLVYGLGDGTRWDASWTNNKSIIDKVAESYYGCLAYGGGDPLRCSGPYNYGDDLFKSISECTPATSTPTGPAQSGVHPTAPAVDPARLKDSLISQFGITMDGFDNTRLQWAWEKLWDVSNTNFIQLVRDAVIKAVPAGISQQLFCPGRGVAVELRQYGDEQIFKYALIHELGHVIRNCPVSISNHASDHDNAFTREGGVTYYANHAASCTGGVNKSEDYAEMIARYLLPNTTIQIVVAKPERGCTPPSTESVNLQRDKPLHYNVARSVLGDY